MRIVSICPSSTEIAAYLGLSEQLVGVDNYSDWPSSVLNLPRLGPDLSINMDKLEALKPDLVLASLSVPGMEKNVENLKERGIPHVVTKPNTLEDIKREALTIGEAADVFPQAKMLVNRVTSLLEYYEEKSAVCHPKKLYWEWWPKPTFTPGGGNWLSTISRLAGGINIFENNQAASCKVTWEDIRIKNPDHICLVWTGIPLEKVRPDRVLQRKGWHDMKAVQRKHIHTLEEGLYCRPSPRLLTGLQRLAYLLHPDIFPEPNAHNILVMDDKR